MPGCPWLHLDPPPWTGATSQQAIAVFLQIPQHGIQFHILSPPPRTSLHTSSPTHLPLQHSLHHTTSALTPTLPSTLPTSATSFSKPYGSCKAGPMYFIYLYYIDTPPRSVVLPWYLVHYHSKLVNICSLKWSHTAAGIYLKPGVFETIASLRHNPNTGISPTVLHGYSCQAARSLTCLYR